MPRSQIEKYWFKFWDHRVSAFTAHWHQPSETGSRMIQRSTILEQAYTFCENVTKRYAKNFYYAFRTLPHDKRQAIYTVYAFCRYCDDLADNIQPVEDRDRKLHQIRREIQSIYESESDSLILTALADTSRKFGIPNSYFIELVDGMLLDVHFKRISSFQELYNYCYKVSSIVGLICIEIFGYDSPKAKQYAIDLGIAMQLTNILRDVKEDSKLNRIYLPCEELREYGYSDKALMACERSTSFNRLMNFQVIRARGYFNNATSLIPLLSPETRPCVSVLYEIYSAILDRIEKSGYNIFDERISLTTMEKILLTCRIWAYFKLRDCSNNFKRKMRRNT